DHIEQHALPLFQGRGILDQQPSQFLVTRICHALPRKLVNSPRLSSAASLQLRGGKAPPMMNAPPFISGGDEGPISLAWNQRGVSQLADAISYRRKQRKQSFFVSVPSVFSCSIESRASGAAGG